MEQKKKRQEDVLVVRDEKTGEISVVAGLDARGYPKRAQAKAEHSQEFLRFDRHGDAIDNFFRNFYRQCKEPTRFGFYRVAADKQHFRARYLQGFKRFSYPRAACRN